MEKFFIKTNECKDSDYSITKRVQKCLESYGKKCILDSEEELNDHLLRDIDCVIVIGGDGTLIDAARMTLGSQIPMLGINMGTLGYLTEVEVQNAEEAIAQLIEGKYTVEKRMMLSASAKDETAIALNDVVVARNGRVRMVQFNLYVNGQFLISYKADGLIVSTPTGSTAYNLSAGGPIVEPTAVLTLVTPICSHALNSNSIVFSGDDEIVIEIGSRRPGEEEEAMVTVDGIDLQPIKTGESVRIARASESFNLIKLSKISFLETLREKMKGN